MPLGRREKENIFDQETGNPLWKDADAETSNKIRAQYRQMPAWKKFKMKGWKKKPDGTYEVTYYKRKTLND
jgi:hypothetical protein